VDVYVKPGDLWQLGRHRLLVGDSTDRAAIDRLLDGARVPLTFTSPPYGVGIDYGPMTTDTIANVRTTLDALAAILADVTTPGGFAVLNFGDVVAASAQLGVDEPCEYPMALEHWPAFRGAGWVLHTRRVWIKPHAKVAAPWTASSNRSATDWEHIWTWKRPGRGLNIRRGLSYMGVWDTGNRNVDIGKDRFGAGMPVELARLALEVYSNPGDLVLEPFTGTGTTLVACESVGRVCMAMELEPRFAQMTIERWQAFTDLEATRVS
jgi:DNA modification methylase